MSKKAGVHIGPQLEAVIGITGDTAGITLSRRLNVIGDRYAEILRSEQVEQLFEDAELNALRDMLRGTLSEPAAVIAGSLAVGWEDVQDDGLPEKWKVNPVQLGAKLASLTFVQEVALIEAIECWWREQGHASTT